MIITLDIEKAFNKIQHSFMIKVLERLGIDTQDISKHKKGRQQQAYSQHQLKWRKAQRNSTKISSKTRLPTPYLFNIVLEVLAKAIRQLKEIKRIREGVTLLGTQRHSFAYPSEHSGV